MAGTVPASAVPTGRRHKARRRHMPMAEINVTPFVDVMLVLLIVFMVAAPLLTVGIPVDLPQTQGEALSTDTEPLSVTIGADGEIQIQEAEITLDELLPKIQAIMEIDPEKRIILRANRSADYGTVAQVLDRIKKAGSRHVALETKALEESDS
jgi:biopolymer transport protein TolR